MLEISDLPTVNATLNTISGILLTIGYVQIRQRKITAHKKCMLAAFGVSVLFLVCYVIYHANAGSKAVHEARVDPPRLLHYPNFAHYFGVCDSAIGVAHPLLSMA